MKCKIFISCMGWGHYIRQLNIVKKLNKKISNLHITIQANKKIGFEKYFINKKYNFIKNDNLIKFYTNKNGSIDYNKTKNYYNNYDEKSRIWIEKNLKDNNYDFFISDFSPEGIYVANQLKKPVFGICHFTWEWFFSQKLPFMVKSNILKKWNTYQTKVTKFFFPPLTPLEIVRKYKNHYKTQFIGSEIKKIKKFDNNKIKVLFMDSGNAYLTKHVTKIIKANKNNKELFFFHPKSYGKFKNSFSIPNNELLTDYVSSADIIIARPGFNTITSVLRQSKPAIYIIDLENPELYWNIHELQSLGLCHSTTLKNLKNNFTTIVQNKLEMHSRNNIRNEIRSRFKFNGEKFIVEKIKSYLC